VQRLHSVERYTVNRMWLIVSSSYLRAVHTTNGANASAWPCGAPYGDVVWRHRLHATRPRTALHGVICPGKLFGNIFAPSNRMWGRGKFVLNLGGLKVSYKSNWRLV